MAVKALGKRRWPYLDMHQNVVYWRKWLFCVLLREWSVSVSFPLFFISTFSQGHSEGETLRQRLFNPSKGYFVKPAAPASQWILWLFDNLMKLKGSSNKHSCPRNGCPFPLFKKLFTEDKAVYSAADLHNVCFVSTWESNPGDTVPWRSFRKHLGCKT